MSNSVYFGGSRSLSPSGQVAAQLAQVVAQVVARGSFVHVGCQSGADQLVISAVLAAGGAARLVVFCVAASLAECPPWVQVARRAGARVVLAAGGGPAVPLAARYLLRSVAAFQGCSSAAFFAPGAGSLAVARECLRSGLPVSALAPSGPVPGHVGQWVTLPGVSGWQSWQPSQFTLF